MFLSEHSKCKWGKGKGGWTLDGGCSKYILEFYFCKRERKEETNSLQF